MNRTLLLACLVCLCTGATAQRVTSPDGKVEIGFSLLRQAPSGGPAYPGDSPFYEIKYDGKPFLLPSHLELNLSGTAELKHYLTVEDVKYSEHRGSWAPVYGEQSSYPDNYNEMRVSLKETLYPGRRLDIVFRAYDEGTAFRYEIPSQPGLEKVVLTGENTEFSFPKFASVWESHGHEGKYYKVYPSEIAPGCELPLTCKTADGVYGAIMEAGCNHYPRAYVDAPYHRTGILRIRLRGEAKGENGLKSG